MRAKIAESDAEKRACFPVLRQLRVHLTDEAAFLEQVSRQAAQGYRLAYLEDGGEVRAVAGLHVQTRAALDDGAMEEPFRER